MLGLEVGGSGSRRQLDYKQNVLASVVDIGAKTDYDAQTRMLNRACCHGGPESKKTTCRRKASGVSGQCHLIWNPRSIGYRGHVKQSVFGTSRQVSAVLGVI